MSKDLGEALRSWIPAVIQQVKPYFTPNDIEKGARWSTDIAGELNNSKIGIICLTKDNIEKPWVMFEAGALSKQLDSSYVCPILFNLDSSELKGPLVQFQATPFNKTEVKKLITTINNLLDDSKLDGSVLNQVFDMWWPKLEEQIRAIIEKHEKNGETTKSRRDEREILEEILALTRMSAKRTNVGRKSRNAEDNEVDTDAYSYLVRKYFELYTSSSRSTGNNELQSQIEELKEVIEYLGRRVPDSSNKLEETLDLLSKMDDRFEYKSPNKAVDTTAVSAPR